MVVWPRCQSKGTAAGDPGPAPQEGSIFDQVNADTSSAPTASPRRGISTHNWSARSARPLPNTATRSPCWQILHRQRAGTPHLRRTQSPRRAGSEGSRGSAASKPLWRAYADLGELADPGHKVDVPDLVTILRHELAKDSGAGTESKIQPFASTVEEKLAHWLSDQHRHGVDYTDRQRRWLDIISDVVKTKHGRGDHRPRPTSRSATSWRQPTLRHRLQHHHPRGSTTVARRLNTEPIA